MSHVRYFLLLFVLLAAPAAAGDIPDILSARDAYELQKSGKLTVIDIRSPREWGQTGIADGAIAITVHQRNFASALLDAVGGDRTRPIAVICATGGRSSIARRYLSKMGFSTVADISEGMLGSASGPGWIRRGLPVIAYHGK